MIAKTPENNPVKRALGVLTGSLPFRARDTETAATLVAEKPSHLSVSLKERVREPEPLQEYLTTIRKQIDAHPEVGQAALFINADTVKQRFEEFSAVVPNVTRSFDMARLDDPLVVENIASLGCTLSASSEYHLRMAKILDVPSEMTRMASSIHHYDTLNAMRDVCPSHITVTNKQDIERLVQRGVVPAKGYDPTLIFHVRVGDNAPHVNPEKVVPLLELAREITGIKKFGLSVEVNADHHKIEKYEQAMARCERAMVVAARAGFKMEEVHIKGGLSDPRTLTQNGVDCDEYLSTLRQGLDGLQLKAAQLGKPVHISVDIGRWLIGEYAIAAQVTGTRVVSGQRQVFVDSGVYGDLNRAMYDYEVLSAVAIPRSEGQPSYTTKLAPTVVQGNSCDSCDKLPGTHLLPARLSSGARSESADWIAFPSTGSDSASRATPFNMIRTATIGMYSASSGAVECTLSPFADKQQFDMDAASSWAKDGRKHDDIHGAVESLGPVKYREGQAIIDIHKSMVSRLKNQPEVDGDRTILIQDGTQVLATIEYLVDHGNLNAIYIAVKAQNDPSVILLEQAANTYLETRGSSTREDSKPNPYMEYPAVRADTASAREMELAAVAGVKPEHKIVSHPHKTQDTLERIKEERPQMFTFDSKEELLRMRKAGAGPRTATADQEAYDPTALVRIKVESQNVKNDLSAKFGCNPDDAVVLLRLAKELGYNKFGVAFHVGTQCCDASNYARALNSVRNIIREADSLGLEVSVVDIGGGFPDSRAAEAEGTSQRKVIKQVGLAVEHLRKKVRDDTGRELFIFAEPGRIISDRGTLVTPVLHVNEDHTMPHIRIGDHIQGGTSGTVHDGQHFSLTHIPVGGSNELAAVIDEGTVDLQVLGGTGNRTDELGLHTFPKNVKEWDRVAIFIAGSYSASAGAVNQGVEPPGVYLMIGNKIIKSPWFSRTELQLNALKKHVEGQKTKRSRPVAHTDVA